MTFPIHIIFIPGWAFQGSIAKNRFLASIQLIDFPPTIDRGNIIETLCSSIEDKIDPKDMVIMGWSLGGLIAVNLYNRRPERYKAIILIASTPCFGAQTNWLGISKDHQTLFQNTLIKDYRIFSTYYLKLISQPFSFSELRLNLQPHIIPENVFYAHRAYIEFLFEADLRSEFSKIKIPTLVIQGGKDFIIPMEVTQYLMKLNSHLNYCSIPNAGHIPFITHQNETNKIIAKFLKECV